MTILEDVDKIVDKYTEDYINATCNGATLEFFVTIHVMYGEYSRHVHTDTICIDGLEILKSWVDYGRVGIRWKAPQELQKLVRDRLLSRDRYKGYDPSTLAVYVDHFTMIFK